MLSKMAQPNSAGGGGGAGNAGIPGGRRAPGAQNVSATGSSLAKQQQVAGSNGHSSNTQNNNAAKKNEQQSQSAAAQAVASKDLKKQQQLQSAAQTTDDKKAQNGAKSTNGKEKLAQNGNVNVAAAKEQKEQKTKEKLPEKKEQKSDANAAVTKANDKESKKTSESKKADVADVIVVENTTAAAVPVTPTSERKSTRKIVAQQKSLSSRQAAAPLPAAKKQSDAVPLKVEAATEEDVEMEPLTIDASPIKSVASVSNAQPTATSTPGRISLFGFRSSNKNINEVELADQSSTSPAVAPSRTFAQISGRRSIRPLSTFTPSKLESYRSTNNELDISSCTNASINATVGSEIANASAFSFSFFGRSRKRERTPPPLVSSHSATELARDLDLSPPKRARFELFSFNLATPFTMLRSRFSKTSISTPARLNLEENPPAGDEEDEGGVQNVTGIVIEEEVLNTSAKSPNGEAENELTVGQEAGLETPKKSGTPIKDDPVTDAVEISAAVEAAPETAGANRSRCAIM